MTSERFLNTYHNASTAPSTEVPADLAGFMLAADPVLAEAAELARVLTWAHQGAATDDWRQAYAKVEWFRRERPPYWARLPWAQIGGAAEPS